MSLPLHHVHTATLSIGRESLGSPLDAPEWVNFMDRVSDAVKARSLQVYTWRALGLGIYTRADGTVVSEESATWVFQLEESTVKALAADLATIKQDYAQESIALTLGTTQFC